MARGMATDGFMGEVVAGLRATFGRKAYEHVPIGMQGRPQYPDTDLNSLLDTYARNEMAFAAINRKATAGIDVRLIVEKRKGSKAEWIEEPGHPFRRLMMTPSNMGGTTMTEAEFLGKFIVSQEATGYFYAEKEFAGGLPVGLHPLNPANILPIPRPDGNADYLFKEGNYKDIIPAERMLVKRRYDPRNKLRGLAPLAVALGSIDADNAQTDFIRDFFNNAGVPSGILSIKGRKISQKDADELRAKWRMRLGRLLHRQHDITVLDEGAEYQKVGSGLNEISNQDVRSLTESRVAMVFDVPPIIIYAYLGLLHSTYDNMKAAWQNFWTASMKPLYKDWADFLTWNLLTDFVSKDEIYAETIRLRWDFSEVEWLKESKDAAQGRARENFKSGIITLNEARTDIDEEPDPVGDYYLRPFNLTVVPAGEIVEEDAGEDEEEADAQTGIGKGVPGPGVMKMYRKAGQAGQDVVARKIEKEIAQLLKSQYRTVAAAVEKAA